MNPGLQLPTPAKRMPPPVPPKTNRTPPQRKPITPRVPTLN
jgi:hypothetical protein